MVSVFTINAENYGLFFNKMHKKEPISYEKQFSVIIFVFSYINYKHAVNSTRRFP